MKQQQLKRNPKDDRMKIVQYLQSGRDYHPRFKGMQTFQDEIEKVTRRKLMLLPHDAVEIHGVMDEVTG